MNFRYPRKLYYEIPVASMGEKRCQDKPYVFSYFSVAVSDKTLQLWPQKQLLEGAIYCVWFKVGSRQQRNGISSQIKVAPWRAVFPSTL